MDNIKEFYILGLPIDTPIGECEFIKIKDYPNFYKELQFISLSKTHIINIIRETGNLDEETEEKLKDISLRDLIFSSAEFLSIYMKVFSKVMELNEDNVDILMEDFDYYRKLILDMNCLKEEYINPNPEIQKWIEKSKRFKNQGNNINFSDIVSSIVGFNGINFDDINNMTMYQLYMIFQRIAKFKSFDVQVLFSTVSTEKIDIENWCSNIDLLKDEETGIDDESYGKWKQNLFKQ